MTVSNEQSRQLLKNSVLKHTQNVLGHDYKIHETPNLINEDGYESPWEPEESIACSSLAPFIGIKNRLKHINDFEVMAGTRDFTYVTMALQSPANFISRIRGEFDRTQSARGVLGRSFHKRSRAIKSEEKSAMRIELEAHNLDSFNLLHADTKLRQKYGATLPDAYESINPIDDFVYGVMGVSRAGFNGMHTMRDGKHTFAIQYSSSVDIANIGSPNLEAVGPKGSIVIARRFELETEIGDFRGPANLSLSRQNKEDIITASMGIVWPQMLACAPNNEVNCQLTKTGAILDAVLKLKTAQELAHLNIKPQAYESQRTKGKGIIAPLINLNPLFDNAVYPLPEPKHIHWCAEVRDHNNSYDRTM